MTESTASATESWGSPMLDSLVAFFADWATRNGFEQDDGDAAELMSHPDVKPDQYNFLAAFCIVWDEAQAAADARNAPRQTMTTDARDCADRVDSAMGSH